MLHQFGPVNVDREMLRWELAAECVAVDLHMALCTTNMDEFGDCGYHGMADLCDRGVEHFLWDQWSLVPGAIHNVVTVADCGFYKNAITPDGDFKEIVDKEVSAQATEYRVASAITLGEDHDLR